MLFIPYHQFRIGYQCQGLSLLNLLVIVRHVFAVGVSPEDVFLRVLEHTPLWRGSPQRTVDCDGRSLRGRVSTLAHFYSLLLNTYEIGMKRNGNNTF